MKLNQYVFLPTQISDQTENITFRTSWTFPVKLRLEKDVCVDWTLVACSSIVRPEIQKSSLNTFGEVLLFERISQLEKKSSPHFLMGFGSDFCCCCVPGFMG